MSYLLYQRTRHCQNLPITNPFLVPAQFTPEDPPLLVTISCPRSLVEDPILPEIMHSTGPQVGWLPMHHPYSPSACPVHPQLVFPSLLPHLGHQLQQRHPAGPQDTLVTRTTGSPPIPKLSPLSACPSYTQSLHPSPSPYPGPQLQAQTLLETLHRPSQLEDKKGNRNQRKKAPIQ